MYPNKYDVVEGLYDEACLIVQDETQCSYLEALVLITNIIAGKTINTFTISRLSDILELLILEEDLELLTTIYIKLISKGFEDESIPIDLLLPEGIGYLIGYLISGLYYNKYNIKILDLNLKAGVFLYSVSKFLEHKELELISFEQNEIFRKLADGLFSLGCKDINIHEADEVVQQIEQYDLLVGNLDYINLDSNDQTASVQTINKYLPCLKDDHYFVLIVDQALILTDQFALIKNTVLQQSSLKAVVVFPEELFINKQHQKCVLIGQKTIDPSNEVIMVNLPQISSDEGLERMLETINQLLYDLTEED